MFSEKMMFHRLYFPDVGRHIPECSSNRFPGTRYKNYRGPYVRRLSDTSLVRTTCALIRLTLVN